MALREAARAANRIETIDQDEGVQCVLNSHLSKDGMLFCQMIRFQPGRDQTVVVLSDTADEFPVEQFPLAERQDGNSHEVVESVLYFGVLENHVVVSQSHALKVRDLERHLLWLIKDKNTQLPDDFLLMLTDRVSQEVRAKVERQPVKQVSLGADLRAERDRSHPVDGARPIRFIPKGQGFDLLESVLGIAWRKELKLADSLDEANLRVSIEVSYAGRQASHDAHEVLDNISSAMRHLEEGDVRIMLKGGDLIAGDSLKMRGYVNVDVINEIVVSFSMYRAMKSWLIERISSQAIE